MSSFGSPNMAALYNFGQPNIVAFSIFGYWNALLLTQSIKKDIKIQGWKKLRSNFKKMSQLFWTICLRTCPNNTVSIIDFYDSQNYNPRFMGEIYPGEHRKVPERTGRLWTPEGRNWQHSACMRQRDVEPVQLCEQRVQHQDQGDNWCQEQTAGSSAESKSIIMSNSQL